MGRSQWFQHEPPHLLGEESRPLFFVISEWCPTRLEVNVVDVVVVPPLYEEGPPQAHL